MQSTISCSKCQLDHLIADPDCEEMVSTICGLVVQEKTQEIRIPFYDKRVDTRRPDVEQYKDRIMKNLKEAGKDVKDISISATTLDGEPAYRIEDTMWLLDHWEYAGLILLSPINLI